MTIFESLALVDNFLEKYNLPNKTNERNRKR